MTSGLNKHRLFRLCFSVFFLVLALIEKTYQALKTLFDHISKRLEVHQNTPLRVVLSTLFSVFENVAKHSQWILSGFLIELCSRLNVNEIQIAYDKLA